MTNCTSASTDDKSRSSGGLWGWAGVSLLACLTTGLLIGLWPDVAFKPKNGGDSVSLPAIQTLAAAQAAWFFLVYPLIICRRIMAGLRFSVAGVLLELAGLLIVASPFFAAAISLSDASIIDVVRAEICAICLVPLAMAIGAALAVRTTAVPAIIIMIACGVVAPMAFYFMLELTPSINADWIWLVSPVTSAWSAAEPGVSVTYLPIPHWPLLAWFVAAAAIGLTAMTARFLDNRRKSKIEKVAEDKNGLRQ